MDQQQVLEKMIIRNSSSLDGINTEQLQQQDDDVLLPGFRFHPTDEELVGFYLRRKVEKKALSIELIKQIDIYKCDPWDLPRDLDTLSNFLAKCSVIQEYPPDCRETTNSVKRNSSSIPTYSSPQQSFCLESENREKYKYYTGASSMLHQQMNGKTRVPVVINNHTNESNTSTLSPGRLSCITHQTSPTPTMQQNNDFENLNGNEFFFRNGNWDELGSVVEFMSDQTLLYGYS